MVVAKSSEEIFSLAEIELTTEQSFSNGVPAFSTTVCFPYQRYVHHSSVFATSCWQWN
jgi:hypothetical protein